MATTTTVRVSNWTLACAAERDESRVALYVAGPSTDVRHKTLADAEMISHPVNDFETPTVDLLRVARHVNA